MVAIFRFFLFILFVALAATMAGVLVWYFLMGFFLTRMEKKEREQQRELIRKQAELMRLREAEVTDVTPEE